MCASVVHRLFRKPDSLYHLTCMPLCRVCLLHFFYAVRYPDRTINQSQNNKFNTENDILCALMGEIVSFFFIVIFLLSVSQALLYNSSIDYYSINVQRDFTCCASCIVSLNKCLLLKAVTKHDIAKRTI